MWISVLLMFLRAIAVPQGQSPCQGAAAAAPSGSPTFVVQAVDPRWEAVMGARISLIPESDPKKIQTALADRQGYAKFWLPAEGRDQSYEVKVELPGFKKGDVKGIPSPPAASELATAYVQVRLSLNSDGVIVY